MGVIGQIDYILKGEFRRRIKVYVIEELRIVRVGFEEGRGCQLSVGLYRLGLIFINFYLIYFENNFIFFLLFRIGLGIELGDFLGRIITIVMQV